MLSPCQNSHRNHTPRQLLLSRKPPSTNSTPFRDDAAAAGTLRSKAEAIFSRHPHSHRPSPRTNLCISAHPLLQELFNPIAHSCLRYTRTVHHPPIPVSSGRPSLGYGYTRFKTLHKHHFGCQVFERFVSRRVHGSGGVRVAPVRFLIKVGAGLGYPSMASCCVRIKFLHL